ncbi:Uncharacterised protein [Mycobacteroides abscessus subsp. abscessus]|uniref:alpha/beta hydrolase family protein n=1 Tax=Mycobacteroides abscessus TaxID=36809 RepID=UPI00092BFC68|nr:hypothetical protein [Mycobacteroides abscessus]SHT51509.1 Uncharacterised protein [Mycobacteroides abscessus subsp. abscessus]SHT55631.1 Uncharacterised protein [Mycobacteroides abscessus subsp. abscessus]SHT57731.1 Uncharacterised protein [Mycobacteroides abscessus subsp. abscessus]SHX51364.1 Uncharacterised protein [Mycobacteroides abscessus subsp. abscessus]SIB59188.1 Uncharacterised protein [Mycobacteroides abscessus subsp. abscessus]
MSLRALAETALAQIPDGITDLETALHNQTGFRLDELSPPTYATGVKIPTLVVQVHHDSSTRPEDVQNIYDNLATDDKQLLRIEGTTRRFDGYNYFPEYFPEHPEQMLNWFNTHFA